MSMGHLIAAEFFKLRKRMMTWVLGLLLVALVVLLYSIVWSISSRTGSFLEEGERIPYEQLRRGLFLETGVPFALQIVAQFGTLLAIILAAGAVGSEYAWGTVRLMATASSGRLRLLTARLIVVCGLVAMGALLAALVAMLYSTVITATNGGVDFSFVTRAFVYDQVLAYGRTLFVVAPYVALAFGAAIAGRSTLAGVGAGIGVAFLEPLVSGLMRLGGEPWKSMPNYLIDANRDVILLQNEIPAGLPNFGPSARALRERGVHSPAEAAVILLVYMAVFLAVGFILYRRRDITAGGGG